MNSADNTKPYVIDLNQVVLMPAKKMESTVIDLKDTVHDLKDCSLRSTIHEGTENTINADNEQGMCMAFYLNNNISVYINIPISISQIHLVNILVKIFIYMYITGF
jgi:hypothetical protein